jgi:hypothetical protein
MIPRAAAARTIARSDQFAQGPRNPSAPTPVERSEVSQQSDSIALIGDAILAATVAIDQCSPSPSD